MLIVKNGLLMCPQSINGLNKFAQGTDNEENFKIFLLDEDLSVRGHTFITLEK